MEEQLLINYHIGKLCNQVLHSIPQKLDGGNPRCYPTTFLYAITYMNRACLGGVMHLPHVVARHRRRGTCYPW